MGEVGKERFKEVFADGPKAAELMLDLWHDNNMIIKTEKKTTKLKDRILATFNFKEEGSLLDNSTEHLELIVITEEQKKDVTKVLHKFNTLAFKAIEKSSPNTSSADFYSELVEIRNQARVKIKDIVGQESYKKYLEVCDEHTLVSKLINTSKWPGPRWVEEIESRLNSAVDKAAEEFEAEANGKK